MYYARTIKTQIVEALNHFPVVLLTGARQVGKSTLALDLMENYVTLDDINIYSSLQADPSAFIKSLTKPVAIDEIQKVPELLGAIKLNVDRNRVNGSYLLTGSANIMAYKKVVDTLAGRIALLELLPLSCRELNGREENLLDLLFERQVDQLTPEENKVNTFNRVLSGGYPEIHKIDSLRGRYQWFSSYISTYIERDIRDIGELRNLDKFIRMYKMLSSRSGNLLNKSEISRDAGINQKTVENYLELLKLIYQVVVLKPYSVNVDKQITKTGKLFFTDSGILCHLLGISMDEDFTNSPYKGGIFETFVFSELYKAVTYSERPTELYFFRNVENREIDFIVERGNGIIAIEVKLSQTVRKEDFKQIHYLRGKVNNFRGGYLFYSGDKILPFGDDLYALPVSCL